MTEIASVKKKKLNTVTRNTINTKFLLLVIGLANTHTFRDCMSQFCMLRLD